MQQLSFFGDAPPAPPPAPVRVGPRSAERNQMLRDDRLKASFSAVSLFQEFESGALAVDPDDDSEGKPNPKFDYRLRKTKLKIDHCSDDVLESFVRNVHEQCLIQNLALLTSLDKKESVRKQKVEVLQWALCVDVVGGVHQRKIVCSFLNCCLVCHVDPDEIRAAILQRDDVRELIVASGMLPERELPRKRNTASVRYAKIKGIEDTDQYPKCYMVGV